ncbi:hypothetical protein Glove_261g96 [Diversispora epigaea]|uniref:Uncharacterized protein n=1 Tax=Diversispora epigaea TaxID=1348612 RepID=A0A397I668_9GLOM|nr:hypothetical protein Glove_261g96 [Diversispora epigaea]
MLDEIDLTSASTSHLAHLFDKAKKTGQKKILHWYFYSERFEKKVRDISIENEINDQMARTQIYNKIEPYLSGIKRKYLRKKTQKARNIYTLFKEIGIDKIKHITYNVDAISSLTGDQIQYVINQVSSKTVSQGNDQNHVISTEDPKSLPNTEVSEEVPLREDIEIHGEIKKTLLVLKFICSEDETRKNLQKFIHTSGII